MYYIRRLIYDLFIRNAKMAVKLIILIILLVLFFLPARAEEITEITEQPDQSITEQADPPVTEVIVDLEPLKKEIQGIREDLANEKAERLESEKQAAEQAEQANLLAEEQAELYALGQSQNNITYGFIEKYRYYWTGSENVDVRGDQYIYLFDETTKFNVEGDRLKYENGSCKFVNVNYSGSYSVGVCTPDSLPITNGWIYQYSNIKQINKPAIYQVSKNSEVALERYEEFLVILISLFVGCRITFAIINGSGQRRGI